MPPKKDVKKDEKTDDWVESVAVSQKKSGAEIRETAVNNASNATALLTKATYHSHPSSSPSSSSSYRKRANLASSKSSTAQKAGKAAKKAAGRSGSRAPAAGSKKKERSRETTRADSDSDDDLVVTKVTKAPKVDQEKVYNAFMKENSLVAVPDAPYVSGHCYFNAVDYSRQHLLQPAVAQTAPARQLRRLVSLVQRSAAYLEILTVEEALPRDKPRRFGAEDVSTWEESCHEVWAVKPPVFREVKRYVGDFEAFSTLTWGRVSVFGLERREKREGEGEKRGREERREKGREKREGEKSSFFSSRVPRGSRGSN